MRMPEEEPDIGRGPGPQPPPPPPMRAASGPASGLMGSTQPAPRIMGRPRPRPDPVPPADLQRPLQLPDRGGGESLPQHFRMDADTPPPPRRGQRFPWPMDGFRPVDRVIQQLANSDQARAAASQAIIQAANAARDAAQNQLARQGIQGLLPRVVDMVAALPSQMLAPQVINPAQVPGQPARRTRRPRAIEDGPAPERPGPYAPRAPTMVPRDAVLPVLPPPPGPPSAPAPMAIEDRPRRPNDDETPQLGRRVRFRAGVMRPSEPETPQLPMIPARFRAGVLRPSEPETPQLPRMPARFRAGLLQPPTPFPAPAPRPVSRIFRAGVLRQQAETPYPTMSAPMLALEDGEMIPGPQSLAPALRAIADDPNREEVSVPRPRRRRVPSRSAPDTPAPIALRDRPPPEETPPIKRRRIRGKQPMPAGR